MSVTMLWRCMKHSLSFYSFYSKLPFYSSCNYHTSRQLTSTFLLAIVNIRDILYPRSHDRKQGGNMNKDIITKLLIQSWHNHIEWQKKRRQYNNPWTASKLCLHFEEISSCWVETLELVLESSNGVIRNSHTGAHYLSHCFHSVTAYKKQWVLISY